MGVFDLKTFLELQGQGSGTFTSVGTAFGMPSCLLNLGQAALSLLPSSVLGGIDRVANEARAKSNEIVAAAIRKLFLDSGIIEYDTESGLIKFKSDSDALGLESDEGGVLSDIGAFIGAAAGAVAAGSQLYRNYQNINAQIAGALDCLRGYQKTLEYQGGLSAKKKQELDALDPAAYQALLESEYARYKAELEKAQNFISEIDRLRADIEGILLSRYKNPSLEPEFTSDWEDIVGGRFKVEQPEEEKDLDIIRLVFGPPKSSTGKFLLSVDGLYYDSQTSGIDPVLMALEQRKAKVPNDKLWKFEFDPNLGGRGDHVDTDYLSKYFDTIFDVEKIDNSEAIQIYYSSDHFLKVLRGQKQKRIQDIQSQITALSGAGETEAIIDNFKQVLISEIARFDDKMNRRKKQIEVAVKAPSVLGSKETFSPGHIPINDFSYLEGLNISIALNKQKKLAFRADEVSGIVLPVKTKYVRSIENDKDYGFDHLYVAEFGVGEIVTDYNVSSVSSVPVASITDVITTDGLFAIYNYLEADISQPSSTTDFGVINCITENDYNNAALIGRSVSSIFASGLSIPYLHGITVNDGTDPSALGSFIKLPDTNEFRNFTYNKEGFSFETWVHAPNLTTSSGWYHNDVSALHRLILACENTGIDSGATSQSDLQALKRSAGTDFTKGLVMGFTRDRRITKGESPSNSLNENLPTSSLGFYIAPTQSNSASAIGFVGNFTDGDCVGQVGWKSLYVDYTRVTTNGKSISDCEDEFCLISVTADYKTDVITIYLDGDYLVSGYISDIFGDTRLRLPSLIKDNSFEYNLTSVGSSAPDSLKYGPKLGTYFTPWILGGGYTDGMALRGNFMGDVYGGIISGLMGYLGSTKFYNKPLSSTEVSYNYSRQSPLFKNISI